MSRIILIACFSVFLVSCKTGASLFNNSSTPHEAYEKMLKTSGLHETALGRQWFAAAEQALNHPQTVTVPYKEIGYFSADKARSAGLKFRAKKGQKLLFTIDKNPGRGFGLYIDFWKLNNGGKPSLEFTIDSTKRSFDYEVKQDGFFLLRIQPELLQSGEYTLGISVGPSLSFPVAGKTSRIGSFWGDARDAGARSHEGIDIFAAKGTPAVAASEGVITSVAENKLGGKVVFMRPEGKDYTLYYAHLDEQMVSSGQKVRTGDQLGKVGNTGNAKNTPSHLHFGIYSNGGAVDPFPYVNQEILKPAQVPFSTNQLKSIGRLSKPAIAKVVDGEKAETLKMNTVLFAVSASSKGIKVELPDGSNAIIPGEAFQSLATPLKRVKAVSSSYVLESPLASSPRKLPIDPDTTITVLGYFREYAFVKTEEGIEGWLPLSGLK